MKNRFIITTTDTIENCPIKRYIDTICSNIVIGTNVFSDFAASYIIYKDKNIRIMKENIIQAIVAEMQRDLDCLLGNL
ncbi:heavy metal-binding domain-containing protein [Barnesiella intestinihominis]